MFVKGFESGPFYTISYLVADQNTKDAIVIDASKDSAPRIIQAAREQGFQISAIINTHGHWDHTADNRALQQALLPRHIPILIHRDDEDWIKQPTAGMFQLPFVLEPIAADKYLEDGEIVNVGGLQFTVLFTPGHTGGSICFYESREKVLFSGDTLFAGSVGRTDLPGGSWDVLQDSIEKKLLVLDDDVVVYPGHGPSTTIGEERLDNPFLQDRRDGKKT